MNPYEKDFYEDIRDKKRTGSGSFHKKGKGVRHGIGQVFFVSDLLKGKEKRRYKGTSKVRRFNMYDTLLNKDQFLALPNEQKKVALSYWQGKFKTKEIQNALKMASKTYYKWIDELGIPRQRETKNEKNRTGVKTMQTNIFSSPLEIQPIDPFNQNEGQNAQILLTEGLNFCLFGEYAVSDIQAKLEKVGLLLEGEDNLFQVEIRIAEVIKKG